MIEIQKPALDLNNFVGQEQAKYNVRMLIESTPDNKMPPHLLLIGESGGGKSTLSKAIYNSVQQRWPETRYIGLPTGRTINTPQMLQLQLAKMGNKRTLIFLDEVHQMKDAVQETLYQPIDEHILTIFTRSLEILPLPPFMVVAATTEPGSLLLPFSNRLQHIVLEDYSLDEISEMANLYKFIGGQVTDNGYMGLAKRSKLNPRCLDRNIQKVISWCNINNYNKIDEEVVHIALMQWGVDQYGFTEMDWRYLNYLYSTTQPQGLQNIAGMVGADTKYLQEQIEPYLLHSRMVVRTKSGRALTPQGVNLIASQKGN